MTTVAVVGAGIVGSRLVTQLNRDPSLDLVVVTSRSEHVTSIIATRHRLEQSVRITGHGTVPECDVAVLACPSRYHLRLSQQFLSKGSHVVTLTDELRTTYRLLELDAEATAKQRSVIIGAGFVPGISTVTARWLADQFATVTELHIAKYGTAGPACARQHQRSLRSVAVNYRDGRFDRAPGGTGRELVWFPAPIYGADCYRAESIDPLLVHNALPSIPRVVTRVAANRRDRLTSWLPPLTPPPSEGGIGAVRVEARGIDHAGTVQTIVAGASGRPGAIAAAVAAETTHAVLSGELSSGAISLASLDDPGAFLARLRERNVVTQKFVGSRAVQ